MVIKVLYEKMMIELYSYDREDVLTKDARSGWFSEGGYFLVTAQYNAVGNPVIKKRYRFSSKEERDKCYDELMTNFDSIVKAHYAKTADYIID